MSSKKNIISKPAPKQRFISDIEYRNLALIILAALILRLIFFFELKSTPLFNNLFSDSRILSDLAQNIVNEDNWFGSIVFYMSPGYTYFLAAIYAVFGKDTGLVRLVQIVINCANVFIIYLLARELFSKNTAYIAAIIAVLYSGYIFYSSLILTEIIFVFFISVFLLLLVSGKNNHKKGYWLLTGLILGIAALFRGNILLLVFPAIYWIYSEKKDLNLKTIIPSRILFFCLGLLLAILPVTLNNFIAGKEFVLLSTNYGINFYIGNNENATGIYKIPDDIDLSMQPDGEKYAEKITGRNLTPSEVSGFWFSKGVDYIFTSPGEASLNLVKKFFLFLDEQENPQSFSMDSDFYAQNYSFLLKLPFPGFYFVFLFSIAGIILSYNKGRETRLLLLFLLFYILSIIIFFVVGRFRLGIMPLLIIFASYGIVSVFDLIKNKDFKKLLIPVTVTIILLIINIGFVPSYSFSNYDAYINLGNSSFESKNYDEALTYFNKSLELKEDAGTYVLIGNTLSVKKDVRGAFEAYKKAIELNSGNPLAHFNLGTLFVQTGDYNRALEAFSTTIKNDSSFADAYRNIAIIHYLQENYKESLYFFEKYLYLANDDQAKETVRKDIEEIKRRLQN